jgi:hypothetical protein
MPSFLKPPSLFDEKGKNDGKTQHENEEAYKSNLIPFNVFKNASVGRGDHYTLQPNHNRYVQAVDVAA